MNLYLIFIIIGIIFVICIISVLIKDILKEKADKKFNEELIDKGLLIQFKYFPIDGSKY
jgi:ABC-type bacteriocin/lantibiotic exporter with double-glycine peptidase domain